MELDLGVYLERTRASTSQRYMPLDSEINLDFIDFSGLKFVPVGNVKLNWFSAQGLDPQSHKSEFLT